MVKNTRSEEYHETEDNLHFSEPMDPYCEDETALDLMNGIIEANNHQMKSALELTKIAVEKNSAKDMNEEEIFSIFKRASKVITDTYPLTALWEKFSA